ncbi:L10-interacting MYB domain-containing protein-like [Olea europaea var. sylvestris]|uniref:L10-interacting MYB domain-containing protein-like n=1 Tax=Olea europaea var. sylvestris TaxID=158386 RepID=UPI000C1D05A0|nr:L10-interacting MYB domain-containing protein-like [Olea europaea var. sylvestris]
MDSHSTEMGSDPQQESSDAQVPANMGLESRRNVRWKPAERMTFIAACETAIAEGYRHGRCFTKQGWEHVVALFNSSSGYNWTKQQLRNHWATMRRDHKRLRELLSCNGVVYDLPTGHIVASEEWWTRKIRVRRQF